MTFSHIKVGDVVTRMLGGAPTRLRVTGVSDNLIRCGNDNGWTFDRITGAEVDDVLEWGPKYGRAGSYLAPERTP